LLIPFVDIADADVIPPLVSADKTVFNWIQKVQKPIFVTLSALNTTSGVVAIVMPWVAHFSAAGAPNDYGPAAERGDWLHPFSWSMLPNRVPFFSNMFETWFGNKLSAKAGKPGEPQTWANKLPILSKIQTLKSKTGLSINPAKALTSRYGLPVQDDKYPVLCQHAAEELVAEGDLLIGLLLSHLSEGLVDAPDLSGFSYWFGIVVGSFPGIFCSGTDPIEAAAKQLGLSFTADSALAVLKPLSGMGWYKAFRKISEEAKKSTSQTSQVETASGETESKGKYRYSMYPMKPYDLFQNGNGFGQVWAIINGKDSLTLGAATGVDVAEWGPSDSSGDSSGNNVDYAEAEFYYDCGPQSGESAPGRNDTGGSWDQCKYNAMWNLKWKARLRRYHPFQLNALKMGELAVYNALGAESMVQKFLGYVPGLDGFGVAEKYSIVDAVKSCLTGIGQGKPGAPDVRGRCPIPTGGSSGDGTVTVGVGSDAPGISNYDKVLH
jgi:hypothetical protein